MKCHWEGGCDQPVKAGNRKYCHEHSFTAAEDSAKAAHAKFRAKQKAKGKEPAPSGKCAVCGVEIPVRFTYCPPCRAAKVHEQNLATRQKVAEARAQERNQTGGIMTEKEQAQINLAILRKVPNPSLNLDLLKQRMMRGAEFLTT